MTKQEIDNWMRDAEFVDSIVSDQDRDNEYETHIYKREEQLYAIYFCNGYVSERYTEGKGFVRGEYELIPVTKSTRKSVIMIEEWRDVEGEIIAESGGFE